MQTENQKRSQPTPNKKADRGWMGRLVRLLGYVPLSEAECIARAGLNDAIIAQGERDRALRKARALTRLAEDAINCFQGNGAIVTEERLENWQKRLEKHREPNARHLASAPKESEIKE